jgi:hypothetical protein
MKAALLSLVLVAAVAVSADAEPAKVFVFTRDMPSGSIDEQLQARRESLQDLVKALSSEKYLNALTLVKNREGADVVVELVSRGETTASAANSLRRAADDATASASLSSSVTKQFLRFRISAGQRMNDLTTEGQLPWSKMAERAADELARWLVENVTRARP